MMKYIYSFWFVMLSSIAANSAIAVCTGTIETNPTSIVSGKMITGSLGGDSWQEVHCPVTGSVGQLWDFKKGLTDPVDPSKYVGTWSISSQQLVHSYDSLSYAYDLILKSGGGYCLKGVSPAPDVDIIIVSAPVGACP